MSDPASGLSPEDELNLVLGNRGLQTGAYIGNLYAQNAALRGQTNYSSAMNRINYDYAGLQIKDILARGDVGASRSILQGRQNAAAVTANAAGRGVDVNTGSALAARGEQKMFADLQATEIHHNAYLQALGLRSEQIANAGRDRLNRIAMRSKTNQSYLQLASSMAGAGLGSYGAYEKYSGLTNTPGGGSTDAALGQAKAAWNSKELD